METSAIVALLSAAGGGGLVTALFKYLTVRDERRAKADAAQAKADAAAAVEAAKLETAREERGLRVTLDENDRITGAFRNIETAWQLAFEKQERRIEGQDKRIDALETQLHEKDVRIDHLEGEIADLRAENTELRAEIFSMGGTPPPRRSVRHVGASAE